MTLDGFRVLLAEDNPTNQLVAVQMLEALGADVVLATDGDEALSLVASRPFDFALIDIEMPNVSGLDVIRGIRGGPPSRAGMPLIALTAYVMREHRSQIDAAGADGVIAKPLLSIEQLAEEILAILDRPKRATDIPRRAVEAPSDRFDMAVFGTLAQSLGRAAVPLLLEKIEVDLVALRRDLAAGLASGDGSAVRVATHSLTSIAGAIGAQRLQYFAQCLNSAAHDREVTPAGGCAPALLAEIDAAIAFVRERQ